MFAQRLKQLRELKGISQIELARRAGLTSGHLSLLENDLRHPTLITLHKLATALGCEVADLVQAPTTQPTDAALVAA